VDDVSKVVVGGAVRPTVVVTVTVTIVIQVETAIGIRLSNVTTLGARSSSFPREE
jgi:hypothetical protein